MSFICLSPSDPDFQFLLCVTLTVPIGIAPLVLSPPLDQRARLQDPIQAFRHSFTVMTF